jgi:hypothetical protein
VSKYSFFEVKGISNNRKDFLLSNVTTNNEFLVKTLDLKGPKIKVGDFFTARIVKKLDGEYFFYGLMNSYDKDEGLKIKNDILKKYRQAIESLHKLRKNG